MVREAELVSTERGLVPKGQGWFVVNARRLRKDTTDPEEACARFGKGELTRYRDGWLP